MLRTDRLTLRPVAMDDLPAMRAVRGDARVMTFSDGGPVDDDGLRAWIELQLRGMAGTPPLHHFAVIGGTSGALLGHCGLHPDQHGDAAAEIGYRLRADAWGRGLATEAARAVIAHGWTLGLTEIVAYIDPLNAGSLGVARKLGFVAVGEHAAPGWDHPDLRLLLRRPG